MEPQWWIKALVIKFNGEAGQQPGFYHPGCQHLHHCPGSLSTKPQQLTKNTEMFFWWHLLSTFLLNLFAYFISCINIDCLVLVFWISELTPHNLPDLHTCWPLQSAVEVSTNKIKQNPPPGCLPDNHCPFTAAGRANQRETAVVPKVVWCINNIFCYWWTNRSGQLGTCDCVLSVSTAVLPWPKHSRWIHSKTQTLSIWIRESDEAAW